MHECHGFSCCEPSSYWSTKGVPAQMAQAKPYNNNIHPRKLTWNLKVDLWKTISLYNPVVFRFHVNFPRCNRYYTIYIPTTQVLVAAALMTSWCTNLPPICPRFDFPDLFAGCAQASKPWHLSKTYVASTWG